MKIHAQKAIVTRISELVKQASNHRLFNISYPSSDILSVFILQDVTILALLID